jgi:formate/nitrite transporter FocA (FNT family)
MQNNLIKSTMAGMAIALGCCLYLLAPNPIVGSILFACGLLCVRIYNLNLFTGKTQFMITNEYPISYYLLTIFGNFLGAVIIAGITFPLVKDVVIPLAATKAAQNPAIALANGIGCGMLMSLATYKKSPLWMCLLCVPGFILAGFNHCIADAYYAVAGSTIGVSFITTIFGNIIGGAILLSNYWNQDEQ